MNFDEPTANNTSKNFKYHCSFETFFERPLVVQFLISIFFFFSRKVVPELPLRNKFDPETPEYLRKLENNVIERKIRISL